VGELFVAAPDGSAVHRISSSPESLVQPAWSADGRKILAAQYTLDEEAASIVVLEVPQGGMR
jgi:Tol biopolymer transport system component